MKKPFPWGTAATIAVVALVLGGILVYAIANQGAGFVDPLKAADKKVPGVLKYKETRNHVQTTVHYPQTPPAGGDHNPTPQDCAVYTSPIANEHAVHSLEHGAVWITYRPDLPAADVEALRAFVRRQPLVVVTVKGQVVDTHQRYIDLSPFPGLPAPIVISSWAHQLRIDSPHDARLQRFVDTFRQNPKYSPEYGITCSHQPEAIAGRPVFG